MRPVDEVLTVPRRGTDEGAGADGGAEEHEIGVSGDDFGRAGGEVRAGAVDAEVGEGRRAGGRRGRSPGWEGRAS
jgi:hypothetical protein